MAGNIDTSGVMSDPSVNNPSSDTTAYGVHAIVHRAISMRQDFISSYSDLCAHSKFLASDLVRSVSLLSDPVNCFDDFFIENMTPVYDDTISVNGITYDVKNMVRT